MRTAPAAQAGAAAAHWQPSPTASPAGATPPHPAPSTAPRTAAAPYTNYVPDTHLGHLGAHTHAITGGPADATAHINAASTLLTPGCGLPPHLMQHFLGHHVPAPQQANTAAPGMPHYGGYGGHAAVAPNTAPQPHHTADAMLAHLFGLIPPVAPASSFLPPLPTLNPFAELRPFDTSGASTVPMHASGVPDGADQAESGPSNAPGTQHLSHLFHNRAS